MAIDQGTVARYCKFRSLDESGCPTATSFQRREQDDYLSVFLLDYYRVDTENERICHCKNSLKDRKFIVKKSGVFATLDIEKSHRYVLEKGLEEIQYQEEGLPHCGIHHSANDLVISELLSQCIDNLYNIDGINL